MIPIYLKLIKEIEEQLVDNNKYIELDEVKDRN